jgi:predicted lipid-binding transport protein (Tim44 family)
MSRSSTRTIITAFAAVIALGLSLQIVDAKPGKGGSSGSRGARTESAVPSTPTAPRTSTGTPASPSALPSRPNTAAAAQAAKPSMMSTMAKGFAMGLIGAGLFGLLSGGSLFGNMSGMMGFLGLLLQVALIGLAIRLAWGFYKSRQASSLQTAGVPAGYQRSTAPNMAAAMGSATQAPQQPVEAQRSDTVGITSDDYQGFQGVLTNLMGAYSNEDIVGIRRVATQQMAAGFIKELHDNQSRGLVNRLGVPTLLQGDLAEAWYEDNTAYATVAMRYSMTDVTLERASNKVVSGNASQPEETVEIWTFRRDGAGQPWLLSAQQQA